MKSWKCCVCVKSANFGLWPSFHKDLKKVVVQKMLKTLLFATLATAATANFLDTIVREMKIQDAKAAADCPCAAENSWCNYAPSTSACPRANVCHGSTTPCDCDTCPTTGASCTGCAPAPAPGPAPTPGAWCAHPADCQADEICCLCNCDFGDASLGSFGCNCDAKGKALPNSKQPHCCGGQSGLEAWCAKAGTPSALAPKCNSTSTIFGIPTPASDFVRFGQHHRCVKELVGCNAGYCDNKSPDAKNRGVCG